MTRKELIEYCRYYKGEKENPFTKQGDGRGLLWFYESKWVEFNEDYENNKDYLAEIVDYLATVGLATFSIGDGVPVSLKALLFNRYCYWDSGASYECVESFKDFYKKEYLRS